MRRARGELISAASAAALLVCMFAFAWYEYDRIPGTRAARHGVVRTENAWQALTLLRWLMLVTIIVALAPAALRASRIVAGRSTNIGGLVTGLAVVTSALLIVRVLIDLPSASAISNQKLGAVLGVVFALTIALGGWDSVRRDVSTVTTRRRRRRQERVGQARIPLP